MTPRTLGKPKKTLMIGGAAVFTVAAVSVVLVLGNQFEYDEAAHQRVIEAYGVEVTDWDLYRDTVTDICDLDENAFELYVTEETDLGRLQLDVEYACPHRMGEFTELTGYAPLD